MWLPRTNPSQLKSAMYSIPEMHMVAYVYMVLISSGSLTGSCTHLLLYYIQYTRCKLQHLPIGLRFTCPK